VQGPACDPFLPLLSEQAARKIRTRVNAALGPQTRHIAFGNPLRTAGTVMNCELPPRLPEGRRRGGSGKTPTGVLASQGPWVSYARCGRVVSGTRNSVPGRMGRDRAQAEGAGWMGGVMQTISPEAAAGGRFFHPSAHEGPPVALPRERNRRVRCRCLPGGDGEMGHSPEPPLSSACGSGIGWVAVASAGLRGSALILRFSGAGRGAFGWTRGTRSGRIEAWPGRSGSNRKGPSTM
jgi:hypothetical protein